MSPTDNDEALAGMAPPPLPSWAMRGSPIVSEIAVAAKIRFMMISFQLACSGIAWNGSATAQRRKQQSAVVSVEAGGCGIGCRRM
ncbi:hypothetical protein V7798_04495 [Rhizobium laguerreae]